MENKYRFLRGEKNANWYEDNVKRLKSKSFTNIAKWKESKINYDLFNNKLNLEDLEYVCNPFGSKVGELPAKMTNKDIVSGKIKAMLGMEMKRGFPWKVLALNKEATTNKEKFEFNKIKEYVVNSILLPIRQRIEQENRQKIQGKELSEEEINNLNKELEEKIKSQTPAEVRKYMQRKHQDPAEILAHQLLEYLTKKLDLKKKFNDCYKHLLLSADIRMYAGILNDELVSWVINPLKISGDETSEFFEDGDWAVCNYSMSPSNIMKYFGDELKEKEIDLIYETWEDNDYIENADLFNYIINGNTVDGNILNDNVTHYVWKSLRKIGFLEYLDNSSQIQIKVVDESYTLNRDFGDININWEWIPTIYETWEIKTAKPIYIRKRPLQNQVKDINNVYYCKLPYYGLSSDNLNSEKTALMSRIKNFQYYYNIIAYKIELLVNSDKGKKILMNIGSVPTSHDMNMETWQYLFESTPFAWFDPQEEGNNLNDVNTVARVLDLSLISDIQKYQQYLEYIRDQCGRSVGITDYVEGQISPNDAVRNTQQNLVQSSYILEPYFELQNTFKRNYLEGILNLAKIAYSGKNNIKLSYVLDDMSMATLNLDSELLNNSVYGIFVTDTASIEEIKQNIMQLSHAAMQNQKIEMSDVLKLLRITNITEAEESIIVAEQNKRENEQAIQLGQQKMIAEENEKNRMREKERFEEQKQIIILKEEERRKTELIKSSLLAASFNPDKDNNNNGINDFLELIKTDNKLEIDKINSNLEQNKFEHQKEIDKVKLENEEKKLDNEKLKIEVMKNKIKS